MVSGGAGGGGVCAPLTRHEGAAGAAFASVGCLETRWWVLDTEVRKEVISVDDCWTEGTRKILENMAARQANGDQFAPAQDGRHKIELRNVRCFFQAPNKGKGAALRRGFAQATGEI